MNSFIIIGLSSFGKYLVQYLYDRNFEVVAIDADEEQVEYIKPYVVKGIVGNAKDKETLKKIGVQEADGVIVSLGEKVDDSLLVIFHLKELKVKNIYVKVLTEDHAKIVNLIETSEVIFPERESAYKLAQRIDNPNILDYVPLSEGYSIIDWAPSKEFIGKTLGALQLKDKYGIQVISIEETIPDRVKLIPRGNHTIKDSDILVVVGKNEDLERLKKADEQ
ncbi:MAG: TrkA family potassium uptake protein [Caldithrix sp.]|nr:TrkA family potassium uptake protein [Caldithrix sp.]